MTVVVPSCGIATNSNGFRLIPTDPPTKSLTVSPAKSPTGSPMSPPTKSPTAPPTKSPSAALTPTSFDRVKAAIFWDKNGDSTQDQGESGVPNVDITVTDKTSATQTVTTDGEGMYMAIIAVGTAVNNIVDATLPHENLKRNGQPYYPSENRTIFFLIHR